MVSDRVGGCPSDAVPYGDWLVIGMFRTIEIRDRTFELVSSIELATPIKDIDVSDVGEVIVAMMPRGLCYLRIGNQGQIAKMDRLDEGMWSHLKFGRGFFCAWEEEMEHIQTVDIVDGRLVMGTTLPGTVFSVDGPCVIASNYSDIIFWNRSESLAPPVSYRTWFFPRMLELRGSLVVWWDWTCYFDPELCFARVNTTQGTLVGFAVLRHYYGLFAGSVAWTDQFLYLRVSSLNSPYDYDGLVAFQTSDPSNITCVRDFDESIYSDIDHCMIGSHGNEFVNIGLNFLEWWDVSQLAPRHVAGARFPGYITDVAVARGLSSAVVVDAYSLDDVPDRRTWGYPVTRPGSPPVLGDIASLYVLQGHAFFVDYSGVKFLDRARMEKAMFLVYAETNPVTEMTAYNESFYRTEYHHTHWQEPSKTILCRWSINETARTVSRTQLLEIPDPEKRDHYLQALWNNSWYLAACQSHMIAINMDSLSIIQGDVVLPEEPLLMRTVNRTLLVLTGDKLSSYRLNLVPENGVQLVLISSMPLSADVFDVNGDDVYAANSTHVVRLQINRNGVLSELSSALVPTSLEGTSEYPYGEPGDLIVDADTSWVIRAAGSYGMFILQNVDSSNGTVPDGATETENSFLLRVSVGFSGGFAFSMVLSIAILAERRYRSRPDYDEMQRRERQLAFKEIEEEVKRADHT